MSSIREQLSLAPERLRRRMDPASLPFETTADVPPLDGTVGQPRALDALAFAMEIGAPGFHPYVSGSEGSGRRSTVLDQVERFARTRPVPSDWVYVHGSSHRDRPRAIALPPGRARSLAADLDRFVELAQHEIPRAFESDDYERRRRAATAELSQRRRALLDEVESFARERSFAVELGEAQFVVVALRDGQPLAPAAVETLPEEERRDIERRNEEVQAKAVAVLRRMRQLEAEGAERVRQLDEHVARFAVGPLLDDLRQAWSDLPAVIEHLDWIEEDLPRHLEVFWVDGDATAAQRAAEDAEGEDGAGEDEDAVEVDALGHLRLPRGERGGRWRANVFVAHPLAEGAPVVFERNPTPWNLVGRIEVRATLGAALSDYRHLKAGALHRANGGLLVLRAADVLGQAHAWDVLKRSLLAGEVSMELPADSGGSGPQQQTMLDPEPIPLVTKVVLIGSPEVFQSLWDGDEDFRELFKVKVDFAPEMPWSDENVMGYAAFVSRCVRDLGLRDLDRRAVARLVDEGTRACEHQGKLTARLREIGDVVAEASFWATRAGSPLVRVEHVERALAERERRSNLIEERARESILEGVVPIDVEGSRVGRVNGLVILEVADHDFGLPSRVSATVGVGRGSVVSVEREVMMSGPIHDKGVLTVIGYLASRYAQDAPLSIAATVSFEQAYEMVEGDSASSTELYALLSALSDLPMDQGVAVTGSVNQSGEMQPVGGVTRKIEGFFAVCRAKGLTGRQGVIVPASNLPHLMLADEVVEAVAAGQFHIWAVRTIDEGMEILTGIPAGQARPDGTYPEGTLHRRVADRLVRYAEAARRFGPGGV